MRVALAEQVAAQDHFARCRRRAHGRRRLRGPGKGGHDAHHPQDAATHAVADGTLHRFHHQNRYINAMRYWRPSSGRAMKVLAPASLLFNSPARGLPSVSPSELVALSR